MSSLLLKPSKDLEPTGVAFSYPLILDNNLAIIFNPLDTLGVPGNEDDIRDFPAFKLLILPQRPLHAIILKCYRRYGTDKKHFVEIHQNRKCKIGHVHISK